MGQAFSLSGFLLQAAKAGPLLREARVDEGEASANSVHPHLPLSENLAEQEQIRKKRSQMDGRIQIVDELGANGGLRQNQLRAGDRVACVSIQNP